MILINSNTKNQKKLQEYANSDIKNILPGYVKRGMCGTMYVGSDRYAIVVTKVLSLKKIIINHLMDEHFDKIEYDMNDVAILPDKYLKEYEEISNVYSYYGGIEYSYRKNNRWMRKGDSNHGTGSIHIGYAENYRDPSF